MKDAMDKVREFHKAGKFPYYDKVSKKSLKNRKLRMELRETLILEELEEYLNAEDDNDIVGIADGLADMIYVIIGCSLEYGIPLDEIFNEIHKNNMTKFEGEVTYREDGKIIKNESHKPPNLKKIIYKDDNRG